MTILCEMENAVTVSQSKGEPVDYYQVHYRKPLQEFFELV
jgi:hypothetical protein